MGLKAMIYHLILLKFFVSYFGTFNTSYIGKNAVLWYPNYLITTLRLNLVHRMKDSSDTGIKNWHHLWT